MEIGKNSFWHFKIHKTYRMKLTNQVTPEREEFLKFIQSYPSNTPLVMVNILKFKEKSGNGDETGEEAYLRYSQNMTGLLTKAGAKIIWMGKVNATVIGDYEDQPDMIALVSYPSKEAFVAMSTSSEYEVIGKDRKIALEYGGLLASSTIGS